MKILIATGLYPPEIGGPATYVKMLETFLPEQGFTLQVVPYSRVKHYPKIFRHLGYLLKLWRQSKGCEVIFALDPVSVGLPAVIVAKLTGKKFILRVPGDYAWEQAQLRYGVTDTMHTFIDKRFSYGPRVSLLCRIETFVAKRAQRIIVPSDYVKTVVAKWGVNSEKIVRIYSALVPISVQQTKAELRQQLDFSGHVIVSAGRLVPNKGFLVLIDAFNEIKQDYPDTRLVLIGDGPQLPALQQQVNRYELSESVSFMGRLPKIDMAQVIKAADVFALNTAHEGLSHQLLEVMDLETPIITTPVGGNNELIERDVNGLLVPYNDKQALGNAIREMLSGSLDVRRLTEQAKIKTQTFNQDRMITEVVQLFKSLQST